MRGMSKVETLERKIWELNAEEFAELRVISVLVEKQVSN